MCVCLGADNYHVTARGGAISNGSDRRNEDNTKKEIRLDNKNERPFRMEPLD